MAKSEWTWKAIERKKTRFDWAGRTAANDREVLLSFFMPSLDADSRRFLPQIVGAAAANLTDVRLF